jgi:hypothetical protein
MKERLILSGNNIVTFYLGTILSNAGIENKVEQLKIVGLPSKIYPEFESQSAYQHQRTAYFLLTVLLLP